MAREIVILDRSYVAGSDLSAKQHTAVVLGSAGTVNTPAAGARVTGVVQNKPTSGQVTGVRVLGLTKMVAGGTVTVGDLVMVDASGRAVTATTGNWAFGVAEDTGTVGTRISVLLMPHGKLA